MSGGALTIACQAANSGWVGLWRKFDERMRGMVSAGPGTSQPKTSLGGRLELSCMRTSASKPVFEHCVFLSHCHLCSIVLHSPCIFLQYPRTPLHYLQTRRILQLEVSIILNTVLLTLSSQSLHSSYTAFFHVYQYKSHSLPTKTTLSSYLSV